MNTDTKQLVVKVTQQSLELLGIAPTPPTPNCICEVCQVKLAVMMLVVVNPQLLVQMVTREVYDVAAFKEMRRKVQSEAEVLLGMTMDSAILTISTRA